MYQNLTFFGFNLFLDKFLVVVSIWVRILSKSAQQPDSGQFGWLKLRGVERKYDDMNEIQESVKWKSVGRSENQWGMSENPLGMSENNSVCMKINRYEWKSVRCEWKLVVHEWKSIGQEWKSVRYVILRVKISWVWVKISQVGVNISRVWVKVSRISVKISQVWVKISEAILASKYGTGKNKPSDVWIFVFLPDVKNIFYIVDKYCL